MIINKYHKYICELIVNTFLDRILLIPFSKRVSMFLSSLKFNPLSDSPNMFLEINSFVKTLFQPKNNPNNQLLTRTIWDYNYLFEFCILLICILSLAASCW